MLLTAASGAIILYSVSLVRDDVVWMRALSSGIPVLLGVLTLCAGYSMVRKDGMALWTPLPWFLTAWTAYYALGSLAYVYSTPETIAYMDSLYPVDDRALLRTNLLNVVGLVAVLIGAALVSRLRFRFRQPMASTPSHDPWRVALLFLAIGIPIKYFLELPYLLGLVTAVLPGSIQYFGSFSGLAILPLAVAAREGRRGARTLLWALVASEILVGLVMLAKLQIIKTVLLVFLGQHAVRPNLRRLVVTGLLVSVGYVAVLSPFVNFARTMLGRASAQDVSELSAVSLSYGSDGRETLAELLPGVQGWWTRLAYPNAQAFAIDQYDQGEPGRTLGMIGYVFVPRFLDDEKPIMAPGIDFTYLIQGTDTSSTGLGFVGEAYWNGGWVLVILLGLFVGALFAVLGRVSVHAVRSRRWLYTPLIFITVYLGLRPDDWFVPAYIGGVLQVVLVVIFLRITLSTVVCRPGNLPPAGKFGHTVGTPVLSAGR